MQTDDVKKLITDKLHDADVLVETDGYHYQVRVISDAFAGLGAVKRQQLIYGCLNQHILDGTLHAVVMKTFTPDEWQQRQQA